MFMEVLLSWDFLCQFVSQTFQIYRNYQQGSEDEDDVIDATESTSLLQISEEEVEGEVKFAIIWLGLFM